LSDVPAREGAPPSVGGCRMRVSFRLAGCPPNWANQTAGADHQFKSKHELWAAKAAWKQVTAYVARAVCNSLAVPRPAASDARREVAITLYRQRHLDPDGAYASVKPVLDGLKGVLLFDDRKRYCQLVVEQEHPDDHPESKGGECVVVTVEVGLDSAEKGESEHSNPAALIAEKRVKLIAVRSGKSAVPGYEG